MKGYLLILVATVGLAGCQSGTSTPPALTRRQFDYTGPGHCDSTTRAGVSVRAGWFALTATDPVSRAINDSLQHAIVSNVSGWLDSAVVAAHPSARHNLAEAARLFADDYQANRFLPGCWTLETQCDTIFSSAKILTVRLSTTTYTGGAHPNGYNGYISFDRKTGHALAVTEMVSDTATLLRQVEQAFRKKQNLTPAQDLEAEGYFLRDGRFFLPDNIALGRTGLICFYNAYEIAPYAYGPIEVIIPYANVQMANERKNDL